MPTQTHSLTDAEWELMRIVWAQPGLTSRQLIDTALGIFPWKEGTVKSFIHRLVQKAFLRQDKSQSPYRYYPALSQKAVQRASLDELLDRCCHKDHQELVAYLIQASQVDQEAIQALIAQLEIKAQTAPQTVACNCPKGQCQCCPIEESAQRS